MNNSEQTSDTHPLSEKQTNTDDKKKETAIAALTDPSFPLPTLDSKTSTFRYLQSFAVLLGLLGSTIFLFWYFEAPLLQSTQPALLLTAVGLMLLGAFFATGTVWVDWWELVLGYWWLSIPIGAAAALVLVLNQEANTTVEETS